MVKSLSISPYFPLAYYNRALLWERAGNFRYSISDMEKYLRLAPDATDARSARDKIYEWEAKVKNVAATGQTYTGGAINQISTTSYSPGNYHFAAAMGGGGGLQIAKNPSLADLWKQSFPALTDYEYPGFHGLVSGDLEVTIRPIKRLGIGGFGKLTGGNGAKN